MAKISPATLLAKEDWQALMPATDSHKGQNGKVLVVGGSDLFHAASKWSLDVVSRLVDMVFYCSTEENNRLVAQQKAKEEFWDGIVVPREELTNYAQEAEVILIGPGMTRSPETAGLTDQLVRDFAPKKWLIDAGALQMIDLNLIPDQAILTPHQGEWQLIQEKKRAGQIKRLAGTWLIKGEIDEVWQNEERVSTITGGNAGLTKGGTGDCLAGLIAGLMTKIDDNQKAAALGSLICKMAGEELWLETGPFYNASDLARQIPITLWREAERIVF